MDPFELSVAASGTTPALLLSAPAPVDEDRITELCQQAEIQKWTTMPSPYTRGDAGFFVENVVPQGWTKGDPTFAIRLAASGLVVGMVDLTGRFAGRYEIGYWLDRGSRGKGIMHAAANAVIEMAFDPDGPVKAHSLEWRCEFDGNVPNWASWRTAWRLGFQRVGVLKRGGMNKAVPVDHWVGTLLREDPREPRGPWDGPATAHAAGADTPLVAADSSGEREGDDPEALVRAFHRAFGVGIAHDGPSVDRPVTPLRMDLVAEEFSELVAAVMGDRAAQIMTSAWERARDADARTCDVVGAADALADLVYVVYGMALASGIDLAAVLAEVQRSNMSKLGENGRPVLRADGKVLKGPCYFPPDVRGALGL